MVVPGLTLVHKQSVALQRMSCPNSAESSSRCHARGEKGAAAATDGTLPWFVKLYTGLLLLPATPTNTNSQPMAPLHCSAGNMSLQRSYKCSRFWISRRLKRRAVLTVPRALLSWTRPRQPTSSRTTSASISTRYACPRASLCLSHFLSGLGMLVTLPWKWGPVLFARCGVRVIEPSWSEEGKKSVYTAKLCWI